MDAGISICIRFPQRGQAVSASRNPTGAAKRYHADQKR